MLDSTIRLVLGGALAWLAVGCDLGKTETSSGPAPVAASIPKAPPNAAGADYPPPPPGRPGVATPPTPPAQPPGTAVPKELESPFGHPPPALPEPADAGGGTQL